jgi:hypothetical protein
MRRLRINFPAAEIHLLKEAIEQFNGFTDYREDIEILEYKDHQVLLMPPGEAAL